MTASEKNTPGDRPSEQLSRPPPPIGRRRIGRYDVIYPLAQGGMASVHVGRLSGMAGFEKMVAIKVIHQHLSGDESFVKMFLDEARLAARIHHPNVGEVIEVGEDKGLYFMVAELILGQSLRTMYRRASQVGLKIPPIVCADIVARVCQGLHEAHELRDVEGALLGVVHRDISPRNILISYNGFVKLIDFGIAWAHGRMSHTDVGAIKGKVGFMPPEQIEGEPLDRRSDVFSLTVVLYLMLTGNHPFPGQSEAERLNKILQGDFLRPCALVQDIGRELERIIMKGMEIDPKLRYASAAELGRDLQSFVNVSSSPPGSWDSSAEISSLMHRLFEDEHSEHRDLMRAAAERVGGPDSDMPAEAWSSSLKPATAEEADGSGEDFTVAGTPLSMRLTRGKPRGLGLKLGVAGVGVALAAVAVFFAVSSGDRQEGFGAENPAGESHDGQVTPLPDEVRADFGTQRGEPDAEPAQAPPTVRFAIQVEPETAAISIDGKQLETGAKEVLFDADGASHEVVVTAKGYQTVNETVTADGDGTIAIGLVRIPRKKPKPTKKKSDTGPGLVDSPY